MRQPLIVPAIGGQDVAGGGRTGVGQREGALQRFDLGDGLLGVHALSLSVNRRAAVNPAGGVTPCPAPGETRHKSL